MQHNLLVFDADFLKITINQHALKGFIFDAPIVFTSANAVAAYVQEFENGGSKTCYAISGNTKTKALQAGFNLAGDAIDGASLANLIASSGERKVTHLCGNVRRDELRKTLTQNGIMVDEVVVYSKSPSPQKIEKFNGVLFFSPSQVDAFLQANELPAETPAFCIGATTAAHVKKLGHKNIIVSDKPEEPALMQLVVQYFDK